MLKHVHLANFKSFADEQVDLAPLTLLVGANASGKSNLLDALRFLQGIAIGMPFDEGENISGRLADYCENQAAKQGLVDWLSELCAPSIRDIDFIETPELDEVTIVLVEKDGRRISARSLSEGTLRFLGMFAALRAVEPGPIVLIEEIDTALHPKGIHLLVQFLEQVVRERDIQIIATTHSPVVLQWLSEPTLKDVVVCGRVPEQPGTVMRRLGALERFDEIVKLENIDVLFTSGLPSRQNRHPRHHTPALGPWCEPRGAPRAGT